MALCVDRTVHIVCVRGEILVTPFSYLSPFGMHPKSGGRAEINFRAGLDVYSVY
jgi:hypothetical protein